MQLTFVPLTGPMQRLAGSGYNVHQESLDRETWQGAELSHLDAFPDVLGAVSEAEFHDWIIGVRHPLFLQNGPGPIRFFDPDPLVRADALQLAASAAQQAHHLGARFIIFPFPAPAFGRIDTLLQAQPNGGDGAIDEWAWNDDSLRTEALRVAEFLAALQAKEQIKIALMPDGPNPFFYEGEIFRALFERFPELSLCLDTGKLGLLSRWHERDPLELTRRWLPWTRYLRLHGARWTPDGYVQHLPVTGEETPDRQPDLVPVAEIARMLTAAQPDLTVILDWRPTDDATLEAAHHYIAALLRG
jgi:sugar phosphate isomerase/epimerase